MNRSMRSLGSMSGCVLLLAGLAFGPTGCATAPSSGRERQALVDESQAALSQFKAEDQSLDAFLSNANGYAIFPDAGKGGFIAGGAYGRGTVYEQGRMIGYADMSQATVGLQAGGQAFSELIVFQDKKALDRFTNNRLEFTAAASAVALKAGAAATARYTDGVAVFTHAKGGLMVEAAIGGQRFTFKRAEDSRPASWQQSNPNGGQPSQQSSSLSLPPSVDATHDAGAASATPSAGAAVSPSAAPTTVPSSPLSLPPSTPSTPATPEAAATPTAPPSPPVESPTNPLSPAPAAPATVPAAPPTGG